VAEYKEINGEGILVQVCIIPTNLIIAFSTPQPVLIIIRLSKENGLQIKSRSLIYWNFGQRWNNLTSRLTNVIKAMELTYHHKCLASNISKMSANSNLIISPLS
jgi:hypothetical protein